jgi:hypothetical protein
MKTEVIFADGSTAVFHGDGGSFHSGELAMERLRLLTLKSAIEVELRHPGMRLTRHFSAHQAIANVLTPITGVTYKRSKKGKEAALFDTLAVLAAIEHAAVVYEDTAPTCDICGVTEEESPLEWNGETGLHFICEEYRDGNG